MDAESLLTLAPIAASSVTYAAMMEAAWNSASGTGLSSTFNNASNGAIATNSVVTAHYDGLSQVCGIYETSV